MKRLLLLPLLFLIFISSCKFEKKIYSKGYHIEWSKSNVLSDETEVAKGIDELMAETIGNDSPLDDFNSEIKNYTSRLEHDVNSDSISRNITKDILPSNEMKKTDRFVKSDTNDFFRENEIEFDAKKHLSDTLEFCKKDVVRDAVKKTNPKKCYLALKIVIGLVLATALVLGIIKSVGLSLIFVIIGIVLSIILIALDKGSKLFGFLALLLGLIDLLVLFIMVITSFG